MNQARGTNSSHKGEKLARINREIRTSPIRLVDQDGQMIGVVALNEALLHAERAGLDLVEISPQSDPPVCKILDYGKFRYEVKKRANEAKKKQKIISVKEIKFRPNIGEGDFNIKLRKIKEFLEDGDKVKISILFRGREIVHTNLGKRICDRVIENLDKLAKIEQASKIEGKNMTMIISSGELIKTSSS